MDGGRLELRDVHLLRCLMWVLDGLDDRDSNHLDDPNSSDANHGISLQINRLAATIGGMGARHNSNRMGAQGAQGEENVQDRVAILHEDNDDKTSDDEDNDDDLYDGDEAEVYNYSGNSNDVNDDDDDEDDDDYYYVYDADICQDEDQTFGAEDPDDDAEFETVDSRIEDNGNVTESTGKIRDTEHIAAQAFEADQIPDSISTSAPIPIQNCAASRPESERKGAEDDPDLCCWVHSECNGRKFATRSNLRRHLREQGGAKQTCYCPRCNASFSRTTARNTHMARGSCNRIRRHSNGRIRPSKRIREAH